MSTPNQDFFQSHFIPAEKPYAVYGFPYDSIYISVGQLIGTIVTGRVDKNGEVRYNTNAVYRLPSQNMQANDHCVIEGQAVPIETEQVYHLGFVGDTVGLKEVCRLFWLEQTEGEDTCSLKSFIRMMEQAGLKVSVGPQNLKPQEARICKKKRYGDEAYEYFLVGEGEAA